MGKAHLNCITCNTWNMISLRLILCAYVLFIIGIEAAPKPDPYWNWNGTPPFRGANPWQWNWNGSPLRRVANPWNWNWIGSPLYNRGMQREKFDSRGCMAGYPIKKDSIFTRDGYCKQNVAPGLFYCMHNAWSEMVMCQ